MREVRFTRDTDPVKEGGPGYKAGDTVLLPEASIARWTIRGALEVVEEVVAEEPALWEETDVNTVDSTANVGGQDSSGGSNGAVPDAPASADAPEVKPTKRSGK